MSTSDAHVLDDAQYDEWLASQHRLAALTERRYAMVTAAWSLVVLILLTAWSVGFVTWVRWFAG